MIHAHETLTPTPQQLAQATVLAQLLAGRTPQQALADGVPLHLSHDPWNAPRRYSVMDVRRMACQVAQQNGMTFDLALGDAHVDAVLTNLSIGYRNTMYIADQVFPRVPVTKESGKYFIWTQADWLRSEAAIRAPGARYQRIGMNLTTGSYSVDEFGVEYPLDDRVRANADAVDLENAGVELLSDQIDLKVEKDVASLINAAGSWSGSATLSGTSQFSDAGSDPLGKALAARLGVLSATGRQANTVVMGIEVFEQLSLHADLMDRISPGGNAERPAMVTANILAALFGVERVLIGTAIENTAIEGAAAVYSYIWGKKLWFGYVAPSPSFNTPSSGYVFTTGRQLDRYREPQTKCDIFRAAEAYDVAATAAGGGYLYSAAVA